MNKQFERNTHLLSSTSTWQISTHLDFDDYPLENLLVDPENDQFIVVSLVFQPRILAGSMLIYWRVHQSYVIPYHHISTIINNH